MPRRQPDRPSHVDSLDDTLAEAWRLLARGVADRRSPFHHPVIATCGHDGRPRARTVILRGVDRLARRLRFHTDSRSGKIEEIAADPRMALHAYDPGQKVQVRIEGSARIHADDPTADAAWAASRPMSRQCYGIAPGPGTPIARPGDFTLPVIEEAALAPGRAHFRAIVLVAESLEWLWLGHGGHRRAVYRWDEAGALAATWLTP